MVDHKRDKKSTLHVHLFHLYYEVCETDVGYSSCFLSPPSFFIIKRGTCLISRIRSNSKWPSHWIYYDLNATISREQPHFTHVRTYKVVVSLPHTFGMVRTCSNVANVRDHLTSKTWFSSFSFYVCMFVCFHVSMFLCCQKHYYAETRSYKKVRELA